MWKSEDSFGESASSFHPVGPKEWIELSLEGTVVGPRDHLPISVNFWLVWSSVWNVYELLSVTATSCPDMTSHIILSRHLLLHSASSPVMSVSLGRSESVADKGWLADKDAPPWGWALSLAVSSISTIIHLCADCCPLQREVSLTKIESSPGLWLYT